MAVNGHRKEKLMKFLIQKLEEFDIETELLYDIIHKEKYLHHAERGYISMITDRYGDKKKMFKEYIPIGNIEFVEKFLQTVWDIPYMTPIEVPEVLRKEEYLLRDYKIVPAEKLPKTGYMFIKDASRLKQATYLGDLSLMNTGHFMFETDNTHKYVISEVLNILSEYRVFVCKDNIKGIQYYDGDPLVMPNEKEITKLNKMVANYQLDDTRPKSYTMDIAIVKQKEGRDLTIIEVHPFACVGLYGFYSQSLPFMYADGFNWYLKEKLS